MCSFSLDPVNKWTDVTKREKKTVMAILQDGKWNRE